MGWDNGVAITFLKEAPQYLYTLVALSSFNFTKWQTVKIRKRGIFILMRIKFFHFQWTNEKRNPYHECQVCSCRFERALSRIRYVTPPHKVKQTKAKRRALFGAHVQVIKNQRAKKQRKQMKLFPFPWMTSQLMWFFFSFFSFFSRFFLSI